ncbi:MAG: hypothetical protein WC737_00855 [Parcubacteria group bacterium]
MAQIRPDQQGSLDQPSVGQAFSSISTFLYVILGGMGALSIVGLLVAAIDYLVAGGDEERVGRSGKTLAFSLIGLAVAVVGIVIINIVGGALQK